MKEKAQNKFNEKKLKISPQIINYSTLVKKKIIPLKINKINFSIKESPKKKIREQKLKNNLEDSNKNQSISSTIQKIQNEISNSKINNNNNNNNNNIKNNRNKKLQTSSTSFNLFNNIIKYINGKYIDSRNKKNISINTNTKIDAISYINRNKKKSTKKKLCTKNTNNTNNTNNINSQNFNSNINLYDFETQNNKDFDLSKKIKKIKKFIIFNKSINTTHSYANKVTFNKPFMEKSCKINQILNLKNVNSS
jgi:hypothetical protein